jgi:hypothetical protein
VACGPHIKKTLSFREKESLAKKTGIPVASSALSSVLQVLSNGRRPFEYQVSLSYFLFQKKVRTCRMRAKPACHSIVILCFSLVLARFFLN